jgi:hypothetical protein
MAGGDAETVAERQPSACNAEKKYALLPDQV